MNEEAEGVMGCGLLIALGWAVITGIAVFFYYLGQGGW